MKKRESEVMQKRGTTDVEKRCRTEGEDMQKNGRKKGRRDAEVREREREAKR